MPSGATTTSIVVSPAATTTYTVQVTDANGCTDTTSTNVIVIPMPVALFTSSLDSCARCIQVADKSVNAISWLWNFGDSATSASQHSSHCYSDTGTYIVSLIAYSAQGTCRDTFASSVHFMNTDETKMITPNVFTPNGDGMNEVFAIPGLDKCEPYSIKIYDRWGNLIFATEKTGLGWDGRTTTGINAQAGVYYYTLTNSLTTKKGFVTLLR